jgi:ribosomal protein L32
MLSSLRRFLDRSSQKVNRSAAGRSAVPAGVEPQQPGERRGPTARERTLMRRRLRALRRRREALMREVGGLVLESKHEQNGTPQLLEGRTHELEDVDAEARALVEALDERKTLDELFASGVSDRCENCGELVARREHYCTNCGAQQEREPAHEPHPAAPAHSTQTSAPPAVVTGASSARSPTPPAH